MVMVMTRMGILMWWYGVGLVAADNHHDGGDDNDHDDEDDEDGDIDAKIDEEATFFQFYQVDHNLSGISANIHCSSGIYIFIRRGHKTELRVHDPFKYCSQSYYV